MAHPPLPLSLNVTEKMLRSYMFDHDHTAWSRDLQGVLDALKAFEGQHLPAKAQALSSAFNKWKTGNHPGELSVLQNSAEYKGIEAFVAAYPVAPPPPPPQAASDSGLGKIGIALYCVPNRKHNFKLELHERLRHLQNALGTFDDSLQNEKVKGGLQQDNPFLGIFLAPEYYFTKPNEEGERQCLDLKSEEMFVLELKRISAAFPRILLIAGTMHYEAKMTPTDKVKAGEQLLLAASKSIFRKGFLANPAPLLNFTWNDELNKADPDPTYTDSPSIHRMADVLLDKDKKPLWVHNVTSLLLNGKAWGTYDKHADYFECKSISPDKSMFVPGTQERCPVIGSASAVRKFRFGVEICFDHANGVLKHLNPANLAFHVVVSDTVTNNPDHMAMRNSGWFLHASTVKGSCRIYRRENGLVRDHTDDANLFTWLHGKQGLNQLGIGFIQLPVPFTELAPPFTPGAGVLSSS